MTEPDTEDLLAGIREWVEIESPTEDPAAVNRMMDEAARGFGRVGTVRRIPGTEGAGDHLVVDVPGRTGAQGPGILILCHLDTVHPVGTLDALPFRVEGDRAYGPGIADMKGGVFIAMQAAMQVAGTTPLPLRFVVTADEETGSATSRALIEAEGTRAKYALVTEPARDGGRIVTGRKGVGRYMLRAQGRAAHSGVSHAQGRSAILEIARQVVAIEALTDRARGITLNVGRIEGGTVPNTVPEHCAASIDLRMEDVASAREIDAALRALAPHDPDVTLMLEGGINRPPYRMDEGIEALFDHARGLAAGIGFDLVGVHTGGGGDASFVADRVPVLDGLGVDGAGAHTLDEHILVSSLVPRMRLLRRLFETLE